MAPFRTRGPAQSLDFRVADHASAGAFAFDGVAHQTPPGEGERGLEYPRQCLTSGGCRIHREATASRTQLETAKVLRLQQSRIDGVVDDRVWDISNSKASTAHTLAKVLVFAPADHS